MQFSTKAWEQLRTHAASQLPGNFADDVLRAARQPPEQGRWATLFLSPASISAVTAACCLLAVVVFHTRNTRAITEQRLAEWQEISIQVASLNSLP